MALTKDDIFEYCKNHSSTNCSDGKKYIELPRLKEEYNKLEPIAIFAYCKNCGSIQCNSQSHMLMKRKCDICNKSNMIKIKLYSEEQLQEHFGEVLKE